MWCLTFALAVSSALEATFIRSFIALIRSSSVNETVNSISKNQSRGAPPHDVVTARVVERPKYLWRGYYRENVPRVFF